MDEAGSRRFDVIRSIVLHLVVFAWLGPFLAWLAGVVILAPLLFVTGLVEPAELAVFLTPLAIATVYLAAGAPLALAGLILGILRALAPGLPPGRAGAVAGALALPAALSFGVGQDVVSGNASAALVVAFLVAALVGAVSCAGAARFCARYGGVRPPIASS